MTLEDYRARQAEPFELTKRAGTLTAAGNSEGARKAWESRKKGAGSKPASSTPPAPPPPADDRGPTGVEHMLGNVHVDYSPAMFDQVIEARQRRMAVDVANGEGLITQALDWEKSGKPAPIGYSKKYEEILGVYRGDPAAMKHMADRKRSDQEDKDDGAFPVSKDPDRIATMTKAVAMLDDEPKMKAIVDRFGRIPIVVVSDLGHGIAGRYRGNFMQVLGRTAHNTPMAVVRNGKFTGQTKLVDPTLTGVIRHEYGHHVQTMLSTPAKEAWRTARSEWLHGSAEAVKYGHADAASKRKAYKQTGISEYAYQNDHEAFAETFTRVAHPGFKYSDVSPGEKPVIDVMLKILKGEL